MKTATYGCDGAERLLVNSVDITVINYLKLHKNNNQNNSFKSKDLFGTVPIAAKYLVRISMFVDPLSTPTAEIYTNTNQIDSFNIDISCWVPLALPVSL